MVAEGEPLWRVARYLNEQRVPRGEKAQKPEWDQNSVGGMIREPLYKGEDTWRKQTYVKRYRTGKSVPTDTPEGQVLRRPVPDLAIVPAWLWEQANAAIRGRHKGQKNNHEPQRGVSRDRRTPLSQQFFCDVCGSAMYSSGRQFHCGGCKLYRTQSNSCWNHCNVDTTIVYEKLSQALVAELQRQLPGIDVLLAEVQRLVQDGDPVVAQRVAELQRREAELRGQCGRLARALADGRDELATVVGLLRERESDLCEVGAELQRLEHQRMTNVPLPSADDVRRELEAVQSQLLAELDRDAGVILKRLITPIHACPFRELVDGRVVLKACFTLRLVALLPAQWEQLLRDRLSDEQFSALSVFEIPMEVELFDRSVPVRRMAEIVELRASGMKLTLIAGQLGIQRWQVSKALEFAKLMKQRGVSDWFVPVTSKADLPPGWPRNRHKVPLQATEGEVEGEGAKDSRAA